MRKPPTFERIYCNQCRGETLHRLLKTVQDKGTNEEQGFWWLTTFEMLQCRGCQEVMLRRGFEFSENDEIEVSYFPPSMSRYLPTWRYNLPHEMRRLLEENYRSLDAENLRLPMMGARALVDMLIIEKIGDVGGFGEKLKELEKNGFVSSRNREVLYTALDVGNAAAHRGHAATESEVQAVMDIVENMLQAVYVFPKMAQSLKKSTPPRPPRKTKVP